MERAVKNQLPQPADLKTQAGTVLGKRYFCAKCGTEVLCSRAGTGTLECCGEPMKIKEAKPLPSSD